MRKTSCLSILMLGFLLLLNCSCKHKADTVVTNLNDQITAQWEQVSDSIYAASRIPGMLIGIWAPDRNLVWIKGKGKANKATGAKPDSSMKYRIGSITKTYTYTVLLMLVDEKAISLDDTLSKYISDFPKADSITIRMLCNHTSGIFDYTETQAWRVSLITNPLRKWTSQELIDLVKTEPFYFSPGMGFYYSNTNTIIAGKIIEQLTGNSVASEIQRRIFASLNLLNTIYPSNNIMPANFIHGYGWSEEDTTDVSEAYDPSIGGCAGALVADIYDLKAWVEFLYKGTLLSPAIQAQRLTVIPAPGEDCEEYGLGIMHKISPPMWGHTGTIFGYKNWAGYCPTKNVTIVILYNATSSKPMVMATRLMNIYLGAVKK
ncbi:MAG: serine hydrolase [Bacteroidetes bacterium]|nr:serine hydrolase [Bacteroidota bacterium]